MLAVCALHPAGAFLRYVIVALVAINPLRVPCGLQVGRMESVGDPCDLGIPGIRQEGGDKLFRADGAEPLRICQEFAQLGGGVVLH